MTLETEISEILFNEMHSFIELNPESDQYSFISSALSYFLFQNGSEDIGVLKSYLNDLLDQSSF